MPPQASLGQCSRISNLAQRRKAPQRRVSLECHPSGARDPANTQELWVSWSGTYYTINCANGHHHNEGRWLKDSRYVADLSPALMEASIPFSSMEVVGSGGHLFLDLFQSLAFGFR